MDEGTFFLKLIKFVQIDLQPNPKNSQEMDDFCAEHGFTQWYVIIITSICRSIYDSNCDMIGLRHQQRKTLEAAKCLVDIFVEIRRINHKS